MNRFSGSLVAALAVLVAVVVLLGQREQASSPAGLRLAVFQADVTPPLGSPVAYAPARSIEDPLSARGVVLMGAGAPIVLCAVDWIGIANEGHDAWRQALAEAAGTTPERVAVHALHQHDGVRCDPGAEALLEPLGLGGIRCVVAFVQRALAGVADALRASLAEARPVTHLGVGEAEVEKVASNRRILGPNGKVMIARSSSYRIPEPLLSRLAANARRNGYDLSASRVEEALAAPEGVIDPLLKMLTFYNGEQVVVSLSYYATHPQSYFGKGDVTSEFVGLARARHEQAQGGGLLVHFNGAAGNIAAGKYNDGSPEARVALTDRLHRAMATAAAGLRPEPLTAAVWKTHPFVPEANPAFTLASETALMENPKNAPANRIRPAMRVAWLKRLQRREPIVLSALHLNGAAIVHLPAESFVEYQLRAQALRPGGFVATAAYGDGGPWYIPTVEAFPQGGYEVSVANAAPSMDPALTAGLERLLG